MEVRGSDLDKCPPHGAPQLQLSVHRGPSLDVHTMESFSTLRDRHRHIVWSQRSLSLSRFLHVLTFSLPDDPPTPPSPSRPLCLLMSPPFTAIKRWTICILSCRWDPCRYLLLKLCLLSHGCLSLRLSRCVWLWIICYDD